MGSLLPMASMTITEVTTGIAVIGAVSTLGLLAVGRPRPHSERSPEPPRIELSTGHARIDDGRTSLARTLATRVTGLLMFAAAAGATIGVLGSLALVVTLRAVNLE